MKKLSLSIFLFISLIFVFGAFQYGNGIGIAPFQNSWQSLFVGIGLVISGIFLMRVIFEKIRISIETY